MSDIEKEYLIRLEKRITTTGVSNEFLCNLLNIAGTYLNLKTIPEYAKDNNISYNGVKNHRQIKELFNVKFVIDNE